MNVETFGALVGLLFTLVFSVLPLVAVLAIDSFMRRSHLADLAEREDELFAQIAVTNLKSVPTGVRVTEPGLYIGEYVAGCSYWRRFVAGLRMLVGGRMGSIEDVLARARREALLRALEQARYLGANYAMNVRFETANLNANASGKSAQFAIEVVAYLTAAKIERETL